MGIKGHRKPDRGLMRSLAHGSTQNQDPASGDSEARHPNNRSFRPSRQYALMLMTLCPQGTKLWASRSEEPMTDDTPPQQTEEADGLSGPCSNSLNNDLGWSFGGHAMVRHANRRSTCTVSGALGENDPTPRAHGPRATRARRFDPFFL